MRGSDTNANVTISRWVGTDTVSYSGRHPKVQVINGDETIGQSAMRDSHTGSDMPHLDMCDLRTRVGIAHNGVGASRAEETATAMRSVRRRARSPHDRRQFTLRRVGSLQSCGFRADNAKTTPADVRPRTWADDWRAGKLVPPYGSVPHGETGHTPHTHRIRRNPSHKASARHRHDRHDRETQL
jgi:hypothetical protein